MTNWVIRSIPTMVQPSESKPHNGQSLHCVSRMVRIMYWEKKIKRLAIIIPQYSILMVLVTSMLSQMGEEHFPILVPQCMYPTGPIPERCSSSDVN